MAVKYIDADKFLLDNDYFADRDFINPRYSTTLRDLVDAAPAADVEPKQRWIFVTERLPEEPGEYLVAYHPCCWDNVGASVKVGLDNFRGKTSWARKKYQRVIAWKKKPEPPKGEQNG